MSRCGIDSHDNAGVFSDPFRHHHVRAHAAVSSNGALDITLGPSATTKPSGIAMNHIRMRVERERLVQKLLFANKLLLGAGLVQLLLFVPTSQTFKAKIFGFVLVASAILGSIGFLIVYRLLDLKGEALEESSIQNFFGPNVKTTAVLMFMGSFFVPVLNLVIIIWAYAKSKSAIRAIVALSDEKNPNEKLRTYR